VSVAPTAFPNENSSAATSRSPEARFYRSLLSPVLMMVGFVGLGLLLDQASNAYTQLICLFILVNIILALSLNLVNGFTGQFSIGHAGFMAIGAYVSAYLSLKPEFYGFKLDSILFSGDLSFLNYLFFSLVAGTVAAVAGWAVGLPSLRLRGDYLAIVTLGFGEIVRVILLNTEAVGGARGMSGIPSPEAVVLGPITLSPFLIEFMLAGFWVTVTFILLWRLAHSVHGRAFLSVREDEIAAEAMGINTSSTKVRAFVISSFFAGVAGSIFAHGVHYLNPSTFGFTKSVDCIIMVVLGGMGSLTGSVLAAIVVTIVPEFVLRPLQQYTGIDLRMVIYSLALIIFMISRPQGIFGTRELPDLFRSRTKSRKESPR
jgi:branched-chain amino acid transport system permease protein